MTAKRQSRTVTEVHVKATVEYSARICTLGKIPASFEDLRDFIFCYIHLGTEARCPDGNNVYARIDVKSDPITILSVGRVDRKKPDSSYTWADVGFQATIQFATDNPDPHIVAKSWAPCSYLDTPEELSDAEPRSWLDKKHSKFLRLVSLKTLGAEKVRYNMRWAVPPPKLEEFVRSRLRFLLDFHGTPAEFMSPFLFQFAESGCVHGVARQIWSDHHWNDISECSDRELVSTFLRYVCDRFNLYFDESKLPDLIDLRGARWEVEPGLRDRVSEVSAKLAVSGNLFPQSIQEKFASRMIDEIALDVQETSAWGTDRLFSRDDVKLAAGRVLEKHCDLED